MVKVGIDALSFYTPRYYLELATLATARGVDPHKFTVGLGQEAMSIAPPGEDVVTMAANAASHLLQNEDLSQLAMVLFATESGIDQSKVCEAASCAGPLLQPSLPVEEDGDWDGWSAGGVIRAGPSDDQELRAGRGTRTSKPPSQFTAPLLAEHTPPPTRALSALWHP